MSDDVIQAIAMQLDEGDGATVWEPAGMWKPKVGDRVRVRLSAECASHWERHPRELLERVDGMSGVITRTGDAREAGHPLVVAFDEPVRYLDSPRLRALLAPSELVPLAADEPTVRATGRGRANVRRRAGATGGRSSHRNGHP